MSLRWKIALAVAAITLVATTAIGVAGYRSTRGRLLDEVDRSLVDVGRRSSGRGRGGRLPQRGPLEQLRGAGDHRRRRRARDRRSPSRSSRPPPRSAPRASTVRACSRRSTSTASAYRVRTIGARTGRGPGGTLARRDRPGAQQPAGAHHARSRRWSRSPRSRPGWWIAGRVTAPLRRLTAAAEHVGTTGRLDAAVGARRRRRGRPAGVGLRPDARCAGAFEGRAAAAGPGRRPRAAHAAHEPAHQRRHAAAISRRCPAADRDAIVADLHAETEELTDLVNEIVAVATGDRADEPSEPLDLADVVADVAARYERRTGRTIVVHAEPTPVVAQRGADAPSVVVPARQRDQVRRHRWPDRGHGARPHGRGGRPRRAASPSRSCRWCSNASTGPSRRARCPAPGSACRSCARSPDAMAATPIARNRDGGGAVVGFRLGDGSMER